MSKAYFICTVDGVGEAIWEPEADVYKVRWGWIVKYDLAGINPEDLRIEIQKNKLLLYGVRRDILIEENQIHYSMEISYSRFRRFIAFDTDLSSAEVTSEYKDGMLFVRIRMENP